MNASQAEAVLRREGRSFHWAAHLLPRTMAGEAAVLYAFCRYVDDLGDRRGSDGGDDGVSAARDALDAIAADLNRGTSGRAEVAAFLTLAERRDIPLGAAQALVGGVRQDLDAPVLPDEAALLSYAYRVAGTVGLMMCPVLDVRAPWAAPFAVDLGIALQMINIARDVVEDARRGRRYLPASDLPVPLSPGALADPDPETARAAFAGVLRMLDRADVYRRSAEWGLRAIPLQPRFAILTATRVYAGIGSRVRRLGPRACQGTRAVVPARAKAARTLLASLAFLRPRFHDRGPPPRHDPALHAAIAGWPGTDPAADFAAKECRDPATRGCIAAPGSSGSGQGPCIPRGTRPAHDRRSAR